MEYNRLFADKDEYQLVKGWYEGRGTLDSAILRRQVEILYKTFAGRQGDEETLRRIEELEAEANAIYSNHRGSVENRKSSENEVREILRTSGDSNLRRQAWEASKSVGRQVEGIVRELARLRNELARAEGYEDHHVRSVDLQELDDARLAGLMDDLEAATAAPFHDLKREIDTGLRERFGVEAVMPWHYSDPFFQSCKHDASAQSRLPSGSEVGAGDGSDVDRYFRDKDLAELTRKTYDTLAWRCETSWPGATSTSGPARTSMPSVYKLDARTPTTYGCWRTSVRTLTGWILCFTNSGTPSTTST